MGHGVSSQGSFWGGRRLFEPQTLWLNKEAPGGPLRAAPGGLLDTSVACRMGRQEDFQVEMRGLIFLGS